MLEIPEVAEEGIPEEESRNRNKLPNIIPFISAMKVYNPRFINK